MSSKGNLADVGYAKQAVKMAEQYPQFVMGFIAQRRVSDNPAHLVMTPGVQMQFKGDSLGQQYNTPEFVLKEQGADIMIVGRGITQAEDPLQAAKLYRQAGQLVV
jgi:uridine monophosphate synthetase